MKRLSIASAALILACIAVLSIDYVVARVRAPKDDAAIEAWQKQVKEHAKLAPKLEAEHKRITAAKQGRRQRIDVLAWLLIATGALFLWSAGGDKLRPLALDRVRQENAPPAPKVQRRACTNGGAGIQSAEAVVDAIIAREGRGPESAIPILQAIQSHFRYLPDVAIRRVCETTSITPAQIAGTSTFYKRFRRTPMGRHLVRVCHGTACHVSGARQISEELRRSLKIEAGQDTDADHMFTLDEVACVGCCSLAPVLMLDDHTVGKLTPSSAREALDALDALDPRQPA